MHTTDPESEELRGYILIDSGVKKPPVPQKGWYIYLFIVLGAISFSTVTLLAIGMVLLTFFKSLRGSRSVVIDLNA